MPDNSSPQEIQIDLREPTVAALWAWLWPGAGHIYQRRYGKGILYMVCILGTWFFGLAMSRGQAADGSPGKSNVVYMQFGRGQDQFRWHYILQAGIGLPAAPAVVQAIRVNNDKEPFLGGFMAPPRNVDPNGYDELAGWHGDSAMFFELGTLYTVVAGLLNILAIYDAYAGPVIAQPEDEKGKKKE